MSRITESLQTPGLAVTPPDFSGAAKFGELQRALGLTARAAGIAADAHYADRREREQEEKEAEAVLRGEAAFQARTTLPQWQQRIDQDEVMVPDGADPAEYARSLVEGLLPEEAPVAYRDQFAKTMIPALTEALVKRQGQRRDAIREETADRMLDLAATRTDEALNIARSGLVNVVGLSEDDATARIGAHALKVAADLGDEEGFARAMAFLDGRAGDVAATESVRLEQRLNARRINEERDFHSAISRLRNDGQPAEAVLKMIESYRGRVREDVIESEIRETGEWQRRRFRDAFDGLRSEYDAAAKADVRSIIAPAIAAGDAAAVTFESVEIPRPDGTTLTYTAKEQIEDLRLEAFAEIDRTETDPARNLARKADWLRRVPEATVPEWKSALGGVRSRIGAATSDAELPPVLSDAYGLWRALNDMVPGVARRHVAEADYEFWRLVDVGVSELRMTPGAAMIAINNRMTDPAFSTSISRSINPKTLIKAADFADKGRNEADAIAAVETRARAYMQIAGLGEAAAIERAAREFRQDHRVINGWWVRTAGRPEVDAIDLDAVAEVAIDAYMEGREGEDPRNYTLIPSGNAWYIAFMDTGLPVADSPAYSDTDLMRVHQAMADREAEKKRQERKEREIALHNARSSEIFPKWATWAKDFPQDLTITIADPPPMMGPPAPAPEPDAIKSLLAAADRVRERRRAERRPLYRPEYNIPAFFHP